MYIFFTISTGKLKRITTGGKWEVYMQTSVQENLKSCTIQKVQNTSVNVLVFELKFLISTGKHQNLLFSPHICLDDCTLTKIAKDLMISEGSFH